jgi:prepilin-type N-terminal cleavage/methylation domain-containing protein
MIFRSFPKRDLFLDSPKAKAGRPNGRVAGLLESRGQSSGTEVQLGARAELRLTACSSRLTACDPRFTVHSSQFTAHSSRSKEGGFTLIEVIAALIIVAVLASMIFPATGGGLWRTARGVGECRELFELQGQMEEIVQAYKTALSIGNGAINLVDFRDSILGYSFVDTGSTGFLEESGSDLTLTATPTSHLLVTLVQGDQRISSIFSGN